MMLIHIRPAVIALGLAGLTACGGGGGGAGNSLAPDVTPAVGVKQLLFDWPPVPGAATYRVMEDPDGVSGFTQTGTDLAAGQTHFSLDVSVHRQDWQNARYLVEACDASACADSGEISFAGSADDAIGYIKPANTGTGDRFGTAVAVSADGNTLAVGAPQEDSSATGIDGDASLNNAAGAGAVYIFTRDGTGGWRQQAYIKASNTGATDLFGAALSLNSDGTTLAVGAYQEDGPDYVINGSNGVLDTSIYSGAVYVFTRDGAGSWGQQAYIKASNNQGTAISAYFGFAVALNGDGNTLAVGAPQEDGAATGIDGNPLDFSSANSGAVYVFTRDAAGAWSQQAYVKASNTGPNDNFGNAVALDDGGDTLAVGAKQEDSNATGIGGDQDNNLANGAGAVFVFARSGGSWGQQAYIKASNTGAGDQFGTAVALANDGNTLAVGAPHEDTTFTDSGAVYLFVRDGGTTWSEQALIKAENSGSGDLNGSTVALDDSGDTLVTGAPGEDGGGAGIGADPADDSTNGAGAVYLFTRDAANAWSQTDYLKAPNPGSNDNFGQSVAVNSDGGTVAAGADQEDGAATGIDGDIADNNANASGVAYLY